MEQARENLSREVDIIRLVRSRRFVHKALKHLLDPVLRKELKSQSLHEKIEISEQAAKNEVSNERSHVYDMASDVSALPEVNDVEMVDQYEVTKEEPGRGISAL